MFKKTSSEPEDSVVLLAEIDDVLPNPFKGFAPWIGDENSIYETKLQQATFAWSDLEPRKGVYNWARLEKNWGNIALTGKRVGFRIAAAIPGSGEKHTPQWLIDQGVRMHPYSIDGHEGLAPDWDDLNYEFIKQTHWSFIGSAGGAIEPQNEEHRKNLDKLHKTLGYRFVLREVNFQDSVTKGDTLNLTIKVENKGVAPFYFQWTLVLYLFDDQQNIVLKQPLDVDIRSWLPGTSTVSTRIVIPDQLNPGKYDMKLAIHDPDSNQPAVMLANKNGDDQKRYLVGRLSIR